MINEVEANKLVSDLLKLKKEYNENKNNTTKQALNKHETLCVEKLKYLITMKTSRYKAFSNYEDLNQEGFEALFKALKTYNPKKGSFFSWAHHYIATRISRCANLHTTIRFPLKYARETTPYREHTLPIIATEAFSPNALLEIAEVGEVIKENIKHLTELEQNIIYMAYGIGDEDNEGPVSINKICKKLNITRTFCINSLSKSLIKMKETVKI